MKRLLFSAVLLTFVCLSTSRSFAEEKFESIFNGKDLTGWVVPELKSAFIVENGILQVRSNADKKGADLWTEKEYENFVIELDFKFIGGTIDSGVFLRGTDQIQIGISGSLKRDMTCSPYIPQKKGYPVEAEGIKELLKHDDWNHMRIEVRGMDYICWLNGKKVLTYHSDTGTPKGPIGLQLHGKVEMAIDFKDLKVAEL